MAREGQSVSVVFAAWIIGAILSIFGALSYAELGAAIPEAGGEYAYPVAVSVPTWGFFFSAGCTPSLAAPLPLRPSPQAEFVFSRFFWPSITAPICTLHIAVPGLTHWFKPYDFVSPGCSRSPSSGSSS